jgi:exonuclease III
MTFNAEFLWDGVAPEEGQAQFPWKSSQTEAEEHMAKVAQVIIAANPDIVNLVQVENLEALTTFNNKFLSGRGYLPYLVKGHDTFTGQDVALLTRVDPENNAITRDDRQGQSGGVSKSVSKNYIAKFTLGDKKFALVGIHLLAIPPDTSRKLPREAQAEAIRSIAIDLKQQGYAPVVLGDFNDYEDAADSSDHITSTPITTVLSRIRALDATDPQDDLRNVSVLVPKSNRYTAYYDENRNGLINAPQEFTSIDHILLPAPLFTLVEHADMIHQHDPRDVSDHFPVLVRLRLSQTPTLPTGATVRIASLLPNPEGDDTLYETATLTNTTSTQTINMVGWRLRDRAGKVWVLDSLGSLQPGESKTITRSGQDMALNNDGDTVDLLNPTQMVVHTVTYAHVDEGELVTPPQ